MASTADLSTTVRRADAEVRTLHPDRAAARAATPAAWPYNGWVVVAYVGVIRERPGGKGERG